MSKANVYQQRPEPGVHAESPLHHAELHKLAGKTAAKAGIVLREKKLLGHLVLRGDAADPAFAAAVHQALGLGYDVHPSNFPVGKAVGSIFAKSQCVIRHTGEDTWELVVRRSFADYFWLWLQDASAEYGLQVAA